MSSIVLIAIGLVYLAACIFLILVILLQSGKGGGLSGMLGGSNPITDTFGSSGAEKTLSKWTTVCGALFFILALALTLLAGKALRPTRLSDTLKAKAAPMEAPAAAPAESGQAVTPEVDVEEKEASQPPAEATPPPSPESSTE